MYSVKGQGHQKREHVGYKVQVAETVCEATLAPGEPTRNFIVGMVTHPAHESDETGSVKMDQEQARMGFAKPSVQYVDSAYVSAKKLVEAQAEGDLGVDLLVELDAQQGVILNIVVGIIGAAIAGWLISPLVGVPSINTGFSVGSFIVSLLGAVVLLGIVNLFRRGRVR